MTNTGRAEAADVGSVDAIVGAFYEAMSFGPGRQPDYDRLRTLFHPEGRLVPPLGELGPERVVYGVESFITRSREHVVISGLERVGFLHREIARRSQAFGALLQIFSTFESKPFASEAAPRQRGINSIQLLSDAGRWWLMTVLSELEEPDRPVPPQFLD